MDFEKILIDKFCSAIDGLFFIKKEVIGRGVWNGANVRYRADLILEPTEILESFGFSHVIGIEAKSLKSGKSKRNQYAKAFYQSLTYQNSSTQWATGKNTSAFFVLTDDNGERFKNSDTNISFFYGNIGRCFFSKRGNALLIKFFIGEIPVLFIDLTNKKVEVRSGINHLGKHRVGNQ